MNRVEISPERKELIRTMRSVAIAIPVKNRVIYTNHRQTPFLFFRYCNVLLLYQPRQRIKVEKQSQEMRLPIEYLLYTDHTHHSSTNNRAHLGTKIDNLKQKRNKTN